MTTVRVELETVNKMLRNLNEARSAVLDARNKGIRESPLRDEKAKKIDRKLEELDKNLSDAIYHMGLIENKLQVLKQKIENYEVD